ncbi:MAG: Holliday junction resolvase RuvX [Polyangiaceae bacterium]
MPKARGHAEGRTAALDLGRARVGVAIDDELGLYAHPRGTFEGRDKKRLVRELVAFAKEEGVVRFVVGLPLDMRGGRGDAARGAEAFAQDLADASGLDIVLWDERMTTVEARRALAMSDVHGKRAKDRIDEAAAVAILQSWLDGARTRGPR